MIRAVIPLSMLRPAISTQGRISSGIWGVEGVVFDRLPDHFRHKNKSLIWLVRDLSACLEGII